ncbi:MAG: putative lipopolysaccharide heptosyltransferase III [Deltaproteobacteria bacterium]|nr:putative lipopolysaccharide heptosyltransferase III [Deltaproteobacteria bacterium]
MNNFDGVKNILVIKLRHIGDVLLTVPAIRALKENFPGAAVSALVNSGTEEMLTGNPLLAGVIAFDRTIKGASALRRMGAELGFVKRLHERRFEMTVDLTGGDRPALIGFLSGARYRLGYDPGGAGFAGKKRLYTHLAERPGARAHTVLRDLGIGAAFGITTANLSVDIYTSAEDDAAAGKALAEAGVAQGVPFVHCHPTSRWLFKAWTDEGMAQVLDAIQSKGLRAVITAGPAEAERKRTAAIVRLMRTEPADLSGALTLKGLAALSRRAALFFGVDSAPMHIAAATGTRVVALFGPSGAFDWGPWDNREAARWAAASKKPGGARSPYPLKNGAQRFGAHRVIQRDWDCVPCGKDGCNGTKKSRCLDEITPEDVLTVVFEALSMKP